MAQGVKTPIEDAPIGVFDSGLGGISVLTEIYRLMPNENYIYFGDSINAPYGTKSTSEILHLTELNFNLLQSMGVKAVVLACNTATAAAAKELREMHPEFPIIGLEPALKPAALSMDHPTVAVMATPLTLRERKFADLMDRFKDKAEIICVPAPKIVEFVEDGNEDSEEIYDYLTEIFAPYDKSQIDCIVLGCTHFPFAKKAIGRFFNGKAKLFDGGEGTARQTRRVLVEHELINRSKKVGKIIFKNSDDAKIERAIELFDRGYNEN